MTIPEMATYTITFLAVYVQVFFIVTFFERRRELGKASNEIIQLKSTPTVAIIVPCWNEEKTVHGTIESLLALDYPKEALQIVVVDDGSADGTWNEIHQYKDHPQIRIFHKENGGKHTAVNLGIENTNSDFVGCLDADSFVAPDALRRIMGMYQEDPTLMAVAPSIIIHKPHTILQKVQRIEYNMGIYIKKMLAYLNAIHVTPGPFSIFRRKVFATLGGFRKAHNTEDMEIAYRMQENHMKIGHCHTAHVYTVAPDTFIKLYKQRLRWIYGFIQNTFDYKHLIFRRQYGNFSFFTLPSGVISISAAVFIFGSLMYNFIVMVLQTITRLRIVGVGTHIPGLHFDWFYINTHTILYRILMFDHLLIANGFNKVRFIIKAVVCNGCFYIGQL